MLSQHGEADDVYDDDVYIDNVDEDFVAVADRAINASNLRLKCRTMSCDFVSPLISSTQGFAVYLTLVSLQDPLRGPTKSTRSFTGPCSSHSVCPRDFCIAGRN